MRGRQAPARERRVGIAGVGERIDLPLAVLLSVMLSLTPESVAAQDLDTPGASALSALPTIPSPDLEGLEPAVQQQLIEARLAFESVFAAVREGDTRPPRPPQPVLAEAYGLLARHYHAYDLRDTAAACYRRAAYFAPRDPRWPALAADLARRNGDLQAAAEFSRRALALQPDDVPTLVHLGRLALELSDPDAASTLLSRALELNPSCDAARVSLGRMALDRGEFQQAAQCFEELLARTPDADRLHYPLALAYRGLGQLTRARQQLTLRGMAGIQLQDPLLQAVEDLASGERIQLLRGRLAFSASHYDQAARSFALAVEAAPRSSRARINLASALGEAGQGDAAIEQYERVLELAPDNITAHFNLGVLLARRHQDGLAEGHFTTVLAATPDDGPAQRELAELLRRSDRPALALSHFAEAVKLSPGDEAARLGEATLLVEEQRYGEALQRLEAGHAALPASGQLAAALAKMLAASPIPEQRDGTRALELALRVHAATGQPDHAELVALALGQLGRCGDAASWLRDTASAAESSGQDAAVQRLRQLASRYESGEPCQ